MSHSSIHLSWFKNDGRSEQGTIPVLFIHGFMGDHSDWDVIAKTYNGPALGVDLPGHGLSPGLSSDSPWFDETCTLLNLALDGLNIPHLDIVGYSLGGRMAMHMAKKYPALVRNLVLESCHPGLESESEKTNRIHQDGEWAHRFETEWPEVLDAWYEQPVFNPFLAGSPAGDLRQLKAEKLGNSPNALSAAIQGFSLGRQVSHWDISHRILFIAGENDPKYVHVGEKLTLISPNAKLFVAKGSGHNVHRERPEQYLRAITEFLKSDPT